MNLANNKILQVKRAGSYFKRQLKNGTSNSAWLKKDISPGLSFIILCVVLSIVFLMGAYFMKEYIKAWSIASQNTNLVGKPY